MISLQRNEQRRHIRRGKQETWCTFCPHGLTGLSGSGFGPIIMFDEMRLSPGESTKPHRSDGAEMLTYIYKGALSQEDSNGNSEVIHAGEFQRMSMGYRIRHKERNASLSDWVHVFRLSLQPAEIGLDCACEEKRFTAAQRRSRLCIVASPDGRNGSLRIHQDTLVYSSILDAGHHLFHELAPGRAAWLHVVHGEATAADIVLTPGDGIGITDEQSVSLTIRENTELLLVDTALTFDQHSKWKETK
jgi:redox-sensitive bicupin YhaK (pirin superfamily)